MYEEVLYVKLGIIGKVEEKKTASSWRSASWRKLSEAFSLDKS